MPTRYDSVMPVSSTKSLANSMRLSPTLSFFTLNKAVGCSHYDIRKKACQTFYPIKKWLNLALPAGRQANLCINSGLAGEFLWATFH